jgi:hypothetical protein
MPARHNLTEWRFRSYRDRIDKTNGNERQRFTEVARSSLPLSVDARLQSDELQVDVAVALNGMRVAVRRSRTGASKSMRPWPP